MSAATQCGADCSVHFSLDEIERVADQRRDAVLLMLVHALRRVHNLYPQADELRHRGTPEQQARQDIHNAIIDVFEAVLVGGLDPFATFEDALSGGLDPQSRDD